MGVGGGDGVAAAAGPALAMASARHVCTATPRLRSGGAARCLWPLACARARGRETQAGAALEGHLLPPGAAFDLRSSSAARTGAPASPTQPLPGSASYAPSEAPSDTDGAASLVSFPGSERSGRSSASLAARLSSLSFEDALPGTATELTGGRQPAVPFSLLLSESESGR